MKNIMSISYETQHCPSNNLFRFSRSLTIKIGISTNHNARYEHSQVKVYQTAKQKIVNYSNDEKRNRRKIKVFSQNLGIC